MTEAGRFAPYVALLRDNPAFRRLYAAQLVISLSTILAGVLSEMLAPQAAVWTMVGPIAVSGAAWIWFSTPARRRLTQGANSAE